MRRGEEDLGRSFETVGRNVNPEVPPQRQIVQSRAGTVWTGWNAA